MADAKRPTKGDLVLYKDPRAKTLGASRTGRVIARKGNTLTVRPTTWKTNQRVPLDRVTGWWPKGAKNRSTTALREVET